MKRLTKKQKAAYPEYIAYIDFRSDSRTQELMSELDVKGFQTKGLYIKAMEESDILAAMRRLEKVVSEYGYAIYLVKIIGKAGWEDDFGRPMYEDKLTARVHLSDWEKDEDRNPKAQSMNWHFTDKEHGESDNCWYRWEAYEDRYGYLEFIIKSKEQAC